ncbi:hypothetical protein [Microbacterium sp.]|uniref:hypothetical protein n=1 Tax=Microbacterium sp. TaxID=51671 RepID=UPI003F6E7891
MTESSHVPAIATLVAADAVDKPTALATIARAVGSAVDATRPARPRVPLAGGVWVEIDIPKFGEPPPLAIDVHSPAGFEAAKRSALALLEVLRAATDWTIVTDFDRVYDVQG